MKRIFTFASILCTLLFSEAIIGQNRDKELSKVRPSVLSVIGEIQSAELSEKRILNIYLPEGYQKGTIRYLIIYLMDGSADEDFIHVVGLYQFYSFPWVNKVPKSIIVGIATVDSRRDFTYSTTIESDKNRYSKTGHSQQFINFFQNELLPYIEKNYKVASARALVGQFLCELLASEVLLKKQEPFSQYIIISPSIWWDNASLLKIYSPILTNSFRQKTDIYLGVGKESHGPWEIPHVMEVDAKLLADKIRSIQSKSITVYFCYLPDEDHATISLHAVFNVLKLLYWAKGASK